jgi:hypothetical protein
MRQHHLGDRHPAEAKPSLTRLTTEDIGTVAAETYTVVETPTVQG